MTRVLAFADLHLKHGSPYDREPGDRLEDQVKVGQRIVEIARERGCSLILNAGDTFEGPVVQPEEYDAFLRIFTDAECPLGIAITGNGRHDAAKRAITAPDIVSGFMQVCSMPKVVVSERVAVACLPWCPVDRLVAARNGGERATINQEAAAILIATARDLREECTARFPDHPAILLGHWPVEGSVTATGVEAITFAEPILPLADLEALGFAAVFIGHVHKAQNLTIYNEERGDHDTRGSSEEAREGDDRVRRSGVPREAAGSPNTQRSLGLLQAPHAALAAPVIIPGSPLPLNFGEDGSHGVWIFDTETGAAEFVPIESRRFVEWRSDALDGHDGDLDLDEMVRGLISPGLGQSIRDAIVKVSLHVTAEQNKRIDRRKLTAALYEAGAWKVMPITPDVERETRARVEGIREDLDVSESLDLWITSQEIDAETAELLRDRTRQYVQGERT